MNRTRIKKTAALALGFVLFGVIGCGKAKEAGATEQPVSTTQQASSAGNKITVNGTGIVKVKPDIAYINLGVTTQKNKAKDAQTENTAQMNKVLEALKAAGIKDTDIQTTDYSIYPQQDYKEGGLPTITGYTVNNSVQVKVRNIDQTGSVLETAVAAGANTGGGISFNVADSIEAYKEALDLAVKEAADKAGAIGKSIGVTVGKPNEVIEQGAYVTPMYRNANVEMMKDSATGAVPVEAGTLTISATVQAVFNY
jgi:uncharacterized protein YggE